MSDKLGCWNRALFLLDMPYVSSTAPSNEATRTLNEAWQASVEWCLEAGDWDFARELAQLSRVSPGPAFGYRYYYEIPADCHRLVLVTETGRRDDPLLRYAIDKGKIATDAETVYAAWMSSAAIDAPGRWSASFAEFVAATLAQRCLKLNPGAKDEVEKAIKKAKPAAEGVDAVQSPPAFRRPGRWALSIQGFDRSREQG